MRTAGPLLATLAGKVACPLFLLAACKSGKHDADVQVAEVKGPVAARMLLREHEEAASCAGVSGITERLGCIFSTTMTTCAWAELESPELAAHPMGKDLSACQALGNTGPRVQVGGTGTDYHLEADPAGGRLAYSRSVTEAAVAYVLGGIVVGVEMTPLPVDWAKVPSLDSRLSTFFSGNGDSDVGQRLLVYAQTKGGEKAVVELMNEVAESSVDRWHSLYARLEDEGLKRQALAKLHEQLKEGDEALITDLIAYPDVQPRDFTALLATAAEATVSANADWYTVSPLLEELQRRKHPLAGELACRIYGMQVLSAMPSAAYEYDEVQDPDAESGALVILAREKTPCRWVAIALERSPCDDAHRCLLDGGLPDPDGDGEDLYDENGEPLVEQRPLCSKRVALSALRRRVSAEDGEEYEDLPATGPLLLAAGYTHDALPKDLVAKNARRLYRYVYPPAPKPEPGDELYEYDDTPAVPCQRPRDLPSAVCHLPLDVTEVTYNGCRLRIDDKAGVVRVEELKPAPK